MRKPKIKFPLLLRDNYEARTMEELREHFDLKKIIGYFQDGRLITWLTSRHYVDEAEAIEKISKDSSNIGEEICGILGVAFTGNVDIEDIAWRRERLEILKQYTADPEVISNVDIVAFDQDDLEGIIEEEDTDIIYLCGAKFILNSGLLRKHNVRYVGIVKNVNVIIDCKEPVDFQKIEVFFDNVEIKEMTSKTSSYDVNESNGILVVDDGSQMRKVLKEILEKNGYNVVCEAENGKVAIEKYKIFRPYLTIMDITMPEMDGITAIRYIKKIYPKAKIIALTYREEKDLQIEAMREGAQDFIIKPYYKVNELLTTVKAVISEKGYDS